MYLTFLATFQRSRLTSREPVRTLSPPPPQCADAIRAATETTTKGREQRRRSRGSFEPEADPMAQECAAHRDLGSRGFSAPELGTAELSAPAHRASRA